jgi:hypothetical protein
MASVTFGSSTPSPVTKITSATGGDVQSVIKQVSKTITKETGGVTDDQVAAEVPLAAIAGLSQTNVQTALEELAHRFYQDSTQPTVGVNEGDLWYDLDTSLLKLYDGASFSQVTATTDTTSMSGGYFRFTTSNELLSGDVVSFRNTSSTVFGIGFDGVMKLKEQASVPTAVEGGIYYKDNELFIGVDR